MLINAIESRSNHIIISFKHINASDFIGTLYIFPLKKKKNKTLDGKLKSKKEYDGAFLSF